MQKIEKPFHILDVYEKKLCTTSIVYDNFVYIKKKERQNTQGKRWFFDFLQSVHGGYD